MLEFVVAFVFRAVVRRRQQRIDKAQDLPARYSSTCKINSQSERKYRENRAHRAYALLLNFALFFEAEKVQQIKREFKYSARQIKNGVSFAFPKKEPLLNVRKRLIKMLGTRIQGIKGIEKVVKSQVQLRKEFVMLLTIPGIGTILGLTIMLEVGNIGRFSKVGNYSSYCRCVSSKRLSNGKKKGENNKKNGNKYLAWAFVEAAHFARRYIPKAQRFYQQKMAKANGALATKALGNKLARASYFIMRDQVPFDEDMLFK